MHTRHNGWHWRLATLLAAHVACLAVSTRLLAVERSAPTIAECRVGLAGTFRVGHWTPVSVDIAGELRGDLRVELTAIDSDGVEVTVAVPSASAGPTLLYTRVGRLGSRLQLRLVDGSGHLLDRRELAPINLTDGSGEFTSLPSTGTFVLQIGPGDLALGSVLADPGTLGSAAVGATAQIVEVEALPTDWFGYDGVDVIVLTTSEVSFCERLAADVARFAALRQWLELGGRLVICVGRNAPQLIAADKPLAEFVPGRFQELVRLPQTQTLETFAAARDAISRSGAQQNIPLPLVDEIEGRVELHGRATDLPILIRAARGFGELTFLGIDPTDEPFGEWMGRTGLLRGVLKPYLPAAETTAATQKLVSLGYDDLAGALRQLLGHSFGGVTVLGFPLVAGLIIGYLLWLGPLDWFFVERVAQRPWIAWLTLPVIILATSFGAVVLADRSKNSGGVQLNSAELVDVDVASGLVRGTCWATLYSPRADRFDVGLEPRFADAKPASGGSRTLVSWLGLPGRGLGGMHAAGEAIDVTGVGYESIDQLSQLAGVPLLTAATKSFLAEWTATAEVESGLLDLAAELALNEDGFLVGSITNQSGVLLRDACLLGGQSGYRLGNLKPGAQLAIGPALSPQRVRAILARRVRRGPAGGEETFLADRASVDQLLNVIMFYDAFGGAGFAGLPSRYHSRLDLSRLLDFDRAILVASVADGSEWNTSPATSPTIAGASTTMYRFVIPLLSGRSTLTPQP